MKTESSVKKRLWYPHALWVLCLVSIPVLLFAQSGQINWQEGPGTMQLGKEAEIDLPEGYLFADAATTKSIMELSGNPVSNRELGLVAPAAEEANWFLVFEYYAVGYIKDDDKDEIDADALLESISEGTEESNKYRIENGFSPLHVVGWFEEPRYDEQTHNLVWALDAKDDTGEHTVNYNVRLLGRKGYMSVTLVTDPTSLATDKPEVETLLAGYQYKKGKRYAEYRDGDKLAGYGLTALVAGGAGAAAVKLGLLGKLGKLLAKAGKLVVVAFLALVAFIKKMFSAVFGRRQALPMPAHRGRRT